MVKLDWSQIQSKGYNSRLIDHSLSKINDKRFDQLDIYSEPQKALLQYFQKFEVNSTSYSAKQPWTLLASNTELASSTHLLYKEDFAHGTYRIRKPGYYKLMNDIEFNPNGHIDDTLMPSAAQISARDYPTFATTPSGYYHMGFFAAITIEAEGVVLNLNGHSIRQSELHRLQQRFFACIELASAPFIQNTGPTNFGVSPVVSASKTYICNGKLLGSSHHSIHGNKNTDILIETLSLANYEIGGIHLNGGKNIIIRGINISNGSNDVNVLATYSQARFLLRYLKKILADSSGTTLALSTGSLTIGTIHDNLVDAMVLISNAVKNCTTPDPSSIFINSSDLVDGNRYGIVLGQLGPVVGAFQVSRDASKLNESIIIHDTVIENLKTKPQEILACSTAGDHDPSEAYGGSRAVDAVGGVIRIADIKTDGGAYKQNVLINAQLIIAEMPDSFDKGKTNIPLELRAWAKNGTATLSSAVLNGTDYYYVGLGDSMGHRMKGDIGIFIQGGKEINVIKSTIKHLENSGDAGAEFTSDTGYLESPGVYDGSSVTGIAVVSSEQVNIIETTIKHIKSKCGVAQAIKCIGASKDINIIHCKIGDIQCAKHSLQCTEPNPSISCDIIHIADDIVSQVSVMN